MRAALEQTGVWTVLEATTPLEILELAQSLQPDCAVLDSTAHTFDALETCWMLRQRVPTIGILILVNAPNEEQLFQFFIHGANAYEPRSILPETFLDRVQRASCGEYLLGSELVSRTLTRKITQDREIRSRSKVVAAKPNPSERESPLSEREIEILQYVAWGNSNKQVGAALKISDQTVKNHITSTLKKLSVNDRTAAVMVAISHQWISMEGPGTSGRASIP
jgi:DNA-binding NarL/FixJ family response regulator